MFLIILSMFLLGGIGIINTATTDLNKNVDMVREVILSSKFFFSFAGKLRIFKYELLYFQLLL